MRFIITFEEKITCEKYVVLKSKIITLHIYQVDLT